MELAQPLDVQALRHPTAPVLTGIDQTQKENLQNFHKGQKYNPGPATQKAPCLGPPAEQAHGEPADQAAAAEAAAVQGQSPSTGVSETQTNWQKKNKQKERKGKGKGEKRKEGRGRRRGGKERRVKREKREGGKEERKKEMKETKLSKD